MKNIHLPFSANNSNSHSMFVVDETYIDCLNNQLTLLFSTRMGTRIRMPEFGLIAYSMLYEPRNTRSVNIIVNDIRYKVKKYVPEVIIKDIKVTNNGDRGISILGEWYVASNVEQTYKFSFQIK